jgi:glycosyltransferase involved in cell wall biosynthesis
MSGLTDKFDLLNKLPFPPAGKTGWPWDEQTNSEIYSGLNYFPKISIVTPSFNQGRFLEQTIRSILLQNYPNLEYIIIDGGSSDETVDIIRRYEQWIHYWVSEKDKGQTHAINKGLRRGSGEIFHWINSDDFYYKDCFKNLAENFRSPEVYVVAGNYRFFHDNGENKERIVKFNLEDSLEETIAHSAINQPSTFFRLDKFKALGDLDERLEYVMDQEIWKRFLFKYGQKNIKIIDKNLNNFRYHKESKTFRGHFIKEYFTIFYSIARKAGMEKHCRLIEKIYGEAIDKNFDLKYKFASEDLALVKKTINSFIFLKARNAFGEKNFELLRVCFNTLEWHWLNEHQKRILMKLKIKSRIIRYKLTPILNIFSKTFKETESQPESSS